MNDVAELQGLPQLGARRDRGMSADAFQSVTRRSVADLLRILEETGGELSLTLYKRADRFTWAKRAEFPVTERFVDELRDAVLLLEGDPA